MITLIRNATVITCVGDEPQVLVGHDILVKDQVIAALGPTGTLQADAVDETLDGTRHLVIPGLINTHHHLYQTLTRGLKCVQNAPLFTWLTELYKRWQHVDYEAIKIAAKVSIAERLRVAPPESHPEGSNHRKQARADFVTISKVVEHCRGDPTVLETLERLAAEVAAGKLIKKPPAAWVKRVKDAGLFYK